LGFLIQQLANLSEANLERFRRLYAQDGLYQANRYPDAKLLQLRDELRWVWEADAEPGKWDLRTFRSYSGEQNTDGLENAIADQPGEAPVTVTICNMWLRREKQPVVVSLKRPRGLRIGPTRQCLPAILAWGCTYYSGTLKVCANTDCATPYFISKRKDQKYCSPECAAPAKREAKRKWWKENRGRSAEDK
jgi:hypothetical protein